MASRARRGSAGAGLVLGVCGRKRDGTPGAVLRGILCSRHGLKLRTSCPTVAVWRSGVGSSTYGLGARLKTKQRAQLVESARRLLAFRSLQSRPIRRVSRGVSKQPSSRRKNTACIFASGGTNHHPPRRRAHRGVNNRLGRSLFPSSALARKPLHFERPDLPLSASLP